VRYWNHRPPPLERNANRGWCTARWTRRVILRLGTAIRSHASARPFSALMNPLVSSDEVSEPPNGSATVSPVVIDPGPTRGWGAVSKCILRLSSSGTMRPNMPAGGPDTFGRSGRPPVDVLLAIGGLPTSDVCQVLLVDATPSCKCLAMITIRSELVLSSCLDAEAEVSNLPPGSRRGREGDGYRWLREAYIRFCATRG